MVLVVVLGGSRAASGVQRSICMIERHATHGCCRCSDPLCVDPVRSGALDCEERDQYLRANRWITGAEGWSSEPRPKASDSVAGTFRGLGGMMFRLRKRLQLLPRRKKLRACCHSSMGPGVCRREI